MTGSIHYDEQISRASLHWLLLAQFILILPHVGNLPGWLFAACLFCGFWRIQVYREVFPFAGGVTRAILGLAGFLAVTLSFLDGLGLDAAVTFLILVFFLKLLETRRARDMYVTIFLGYFVAATPLLYSQSLAGTLYATLSFLLLSIALLSLHQPPGQAAGIAAGRTLMLLLQGLPVLLVLFFLFPRLDPLWRMPMPSAEHRPGVGDTVALGSFGHLARSGEVAFRARFASGIPPAHELYWRGLVFEAFTDGVWRASSGSPALSSTGWPDWAEGPEHRYTVILEPSGQRWLFALPLARSPDGGVRASAAFTLRRDRESQGRFQYHVSSRRADGLFEDLDAVGLGRNLALPGVDNPRARAMGRQLAEHHHSPEALAAAAMGLFQRDGYVYTLKPPVYASDSIDGFLFQSRRGYCEHYASSFVFLLRAAGVPARLVGGYLGGELNPFEDYISVRQMDAHVWAEVWLEGRGWVRYDPTAVVAPERLYQSVESTLLARNEFSPGGLFGLLANSELPWVQNVRLWWDAVNYGWSQWFLNYDRGDQLRWMDRWLGVSGLGALVQALIGMLLASCLLMFLWMARGLLGGRKPPAHGAALLLAWLLAGLGSTRRAEETMVRYCARVAEEFPQLAGNMAEFAAVYSALAYAELRYSGLRRQRLHGLVCILAWQVLKIRLGDGWGKGTAGRVADGRE